MKNKKVLPPTYFLGYLLAAWALHGTLPIAHVVRPPFNYLGGLLIALGLLMNMWSFALFLRQETTIKPFQPSSSLVVDGPFCVSRNPMYVGMVLMLLGVAVRLGSLVTFLAPTAMFLTVQRAFIPHEEVMLEQTFGQIYLNYKQRVRRWL